MGPQEFSITAFGLSNKYVLIITAVLVVLLFAYLFYLLSKRKKLAMERSPDSYKGVFQQLKENKSTIRAIVRRNIAGRYNNSYFGILWNIIGPFLLVLAIYLIFINVKMLHTDRGYWAYICSGYFVVTMCRQSLGGMSFRGNGAIIRKLPNPPWIVALADTISNMIVFLIPFIFILIFVSLKNPDFTWSALGWMPVMIVIMFVFGFGLTMIFSTLTVLVGDVKQVMVTVSRIIIWVSPVFFYLCDCSQSLYDASMCNPFTYVIEPFHQMMSYGMSADVLLVGTAALLAMFFAVLGAVVYVHKINRIRELI